VAVILKIQEARSSEMSEQAYYRTRCGNPEDHKLYKLVNEFCVQYILKRVVKRGICVVSPDKFRVMMSNDPVTAESSLIITKNN